MSNRSNVVGLACLLGWCVFSAIARVLTSQVSQQINPALLCCYSFLIAGLVFWALNCNKIKHTFAKSCHKGNLKNIFWLNLSTFGAWFFLIYPLKFIQPAMVSSITLAFGPISTLLLSLFIYKTQKILFFDGFISFLLLAVICFISGLCFANITTLSQLPVFTVFYAIVSCLIVGFSTAASNLFAKRLSNNQFTPIEILCVRFFVTILLTAFITDISGTSFLLTKGDFENIMLVAGCLVIIPLYLAQIGIKHLEPMTVAITTPLMPVLVLFLELMNHQHFSKWAIDSVLVIFLLMMVNACFYVKKHNTSKKNQRTNLSLSDEPTALPLN